MTTGNPPVVTVTASDPLLAVGESGVLNVVVTDTDTIPVVNRVTLTIVATDETGLQSPPQDVDIDVVVGERAENVTVTVTSSDPAVLAVTEIIPGVQYEYTAV